MREKVVRVELAGGVGNQLFQYFAGQCLATRNNTKLELDVSLIGVNGTFHRSSLEYFDLDLQFINSKSKRLFNRTIIGRVSRKLYRTSHSYKRIFSLFSKRYESPVLGFDEKLLAQNPEITIAGYFQTRNYFFECTSGENFSLNLRKPTDWFLRMEREATQDKILAIHVRRGDYVPLKESFGLLDRQYYLAAIEKAKQNFDYNKVWVFSDDIEMARKVLQDMSDLIFIESPVFSNPVESLILMSKCQSFIISNSTFAWWAATLNSKNHVIYPKPWFKDSEYSKDLYVPKWLALESKWEL
jgi:hypothetical protein